MLEAPRRRKANYEASGNVITIPGTSPESNHGMQQPLSETYVNQHQSLGVHTIGIINLASSNCNSLQQEFMLSASFAR
uniref:Uncharacterized protein n=1 Tax=Oryza meridionalis TaxID=40149 RepID=A0A0E0DD12_9ORYZ